MSCCEIGLDVSWDYCIYVKARQGFLSNLALKYVKYMNEAAPNQTAANCITIKQTMGRQTKACITKSHASRGRTEHD
jgi:hypothetical protein